MVCLVVCSMICCVPRGQTNHPAPNPRSRQTSPVITTTAHVGWAVSLARVARIPSMVLVSVRNSFRRRAVSLRSAFSVAAAVVTASLASSSATTATAMTGSGDVSESNISPPILLPLLVWRDPHPQTRPARVFAIFDGLEDLVDLLLQAATGFASREAFPGWRPRWFNVDPVLASFDQERLGSDIRGRRAAFAERRIGGFNEGLGLDLAGIAFEAREAGLERVSLPVQLLDVLSWRRRGNGVLPCLPNALQDLGMVHAGSDAYRLLALLPGGGRVSLFDGVVCSMGSVVVEHLAPGLGDDALVLRFIRVRRQCPGFWLSLKATGCEGPRMKPGGDPVDLQIGILDVGIRYALPLGFAKTGQRFGLLRPAPFGMRRVVALKELLGAAVDPVQGASTPEAVHVGIGPTPGRGRFMHRPDVDVLCAEVEVKQVPRGSKLLLAGELTREGELPFDIRRAIGSLVFFGSRQVGACILRPARQIGRALVDQVIPESLGAGCLVQMVHPCLCWSVGAFPADVLHPLRRTRFPTPTLKRRALKAPHRHHVTSWLVGPLSLFPVRETPNKP